MNSRDEDVSDGQGTERSSAAVEAVVCVSCGEAIAGVFFRASGQVVCAGCRERWIAEREAGTPAGRFVRAAALGVGAAVVSAVGWYWIARLTEREFGLIAILVGLLVGGAVRLGSRRRGGWAYQALAILLTYTAIVSSYIPGILEAAKEWENETEVAELAAAELVEAEPAAVGVAADGASTGGAPEVASGDAVVAAAGTEGAQGALADEETEMPAAGEQGAAEAAPAALVEGGPIVGGVAGLAIGILLLVALAFAAPFLGGFENIFGWVILGIALYQAWTMNRREVLEFEGPFTSSGGRSTYIPETPPPPIAP